jgi:hypothetical protein
MKRDKTIYWISTGIIIAVMLFSVVNFTFIDQYPFPEGAFKHLQLPGYFKNRNEDIATNFKTSICKHFAECLLF